MNDETLLPRLTAGIDIDTYAALLRESRIESWDDMQAADVELMLRLRAKYERALAKQIPLLQRWLVVTVALATFVRVPVNIEFAALSLTHLSREQLDELVAKAVREDFKFLRDIE